MHTQESDSLFKETFTSLCNGFLYSFMIAGWILKASFLGLLDITGYLTIKFYEFVLSPAAFRRYGRWAVACWRFAVRSYLFVENCGIYLSTRFKHTFYLQGRIGLLFIDVEKNGRDGYFILRQYGDDKMTEMNYRIDNRWIALKEMPSSADLNGIMSQALDQGLQVAHLYWNDRLMKPYDLARLAVIDKPVVHYSDRAILWGERRWVAEVPQDRVRLDPRKAQDIIHLA